MPIAFLIKELQMVKTYLYGGFGGLIVGAIVAPNELIHLTFPLILGAGAIHSSTENYFKTNQGFNSQAAEEQTSVILVVEPGAELEINITRFLRVSLGGSYRIVENTDITDVSNKSLSGFSENFSLKFGSFR